MPQSAPRSSRPNVLFFFADDQRFDTIRALGNPEVSTPTIDTLVRRGVAFTHAHIPGGTVPAVCMPSRAMLHSGRSLFHLSGAGQTIPSAHTTLGEAFRSAGYRTFGTGKWHNGAESFNRSFSDGDEIFLGGMADHWNVPAFHYDPSGAYATQLPLCPDPGRSNEVVQRCCDHISAGVHSSRLVTDAAVDFIKDSTAETPFFAYVSFLAPHDPRTMPERFRAMYDPERIELPANFAGGHPFDNGELHIRDEMLAGFPRTPEETRRHIAEYYAMISHLDYEMGRVVDALKASGRADNTIVVFAADNGLAVGRHGLFGKQNCYEHSIRVPLIFSGPGVPSGETSDAYAYLFDVFPTLCDLSGIDIPRSVEGTSLRPAIAGTNDSVRDTLYLAYKDVQRGVKTRSHKLIEYVVNGRHTRSQLFNMESDPDELHDLSDDPASKTTIGELRAELRRLRDSWDDPDSEWGARFWAGMED